MTSVFGLPDWVPWWAQLLLLIVAILFFLALFLMPFSVFGLKSRLEGVEAGLAELQGEIRALALRLPEPGRRQLYAEEPFGRATPAEDRAGERAPERAGDRAPAPRPPVPPANWTPDGAPRRPIGAGVQPPSRQEPSLDRARAEPRIDRFR
jgi:hypothetical protein